MSIDAIGGTDRWDLRYHSPGWFGTFKDHVIDLTQLIEKHGFDVNAYPELVQNSHMKSPARLGEIIALPTTPAAPMLIYRRDWFEDPDEKAAFEAKYGRALAAPSTFAELRDVAEFFTRDAGETLAGKTLERSVYGWSDALGAGAGITRSFIVMLYSTGVSGWDESYEPDIEHPIVAEVAEYFVDLAQNFAPREAQSWGFLEGLEMFRDGRMATATMWPQGVGTVEDPSGEAAGNTAYTTLPLWENNLAGYTQGHPFLGGVAASSNSIRPTRTKRTNSLNGCCRTMRSNSASKAFSSRALVTSKAKNFETSSRIMPTSCQHSKRCWTRYSFARAFLNGVR